MSNISELKKEVVKKFEEFIKKPQTIIQGLRDGKSSHLQEFYQQFAEAYIYPDMADFTSKLPPVEMKDAETVAAIIGDKSRASGEYNSQDNKVYMYFNKLQKIANSKNPTSKAIISEFVTSVEVLCHEYQHSKQKLYANLLNNGETEKANEFSGQLAKYSSDIVQDIDFNGAECISVIKETRPDLYSEMASKTKEPSVEGADPVVEAFYYRRPIERDARDTSLRMFDEFTKDTLKSGKLKSWAFLTRQKLQALKRHKRDMSRQPVHISKDDILGQLKKMNPEDFAKYAQGAESIYVGLSENEKSELTSKSILNGNSTNEDEYRLEEFVCTIHELTNALKPEDAINVLQGIQQECAKNNLSFGEKISSEFLESLKAPRVRSVNQKDYDSEGIVKDSSNQQPIVSGLHQQQENQNEEINENSKRIDEIENEL